MVIRIKKILKSILIISIILSVATIKSFAVNTDSIDVFSYNDMGYMTPFSVQDEIEKFIKSLTANIEEKTPTIEEEKEYEYDVENVEVKYLTKSGEVDSKLLIIYKPKNFKGKIPLMYSAFYPVQKTYITKAIKHGFAIAGILDDDLIGRYKSLPFDTLVFNNAALWTLKNLSYIDKQKIIVFGDSCGGYIALMLNALQLGITATIANSPITDLEFNLNYFDLCHRLNDNALSNPIVQAIWSCMLPIREGFDNKEQWDYYAPAHIANCFSSKTIITHYTGDLLVPIGQISKKYEYPNFDQNISLSFNPFYKNGLSLDEAATNYGKEFQFINNTVNYEEKKDLLLVAYIYNDGPIKSTNLHVSPDDAPCLNFDSLLLGVKEKELKDSQYLTNEKILLLLERYQGHSKQLPVHLDADENIYGSLKMYQNEIIEELKTYVINHSFSELEDKVNTAIKTINNASRRQECEFVWRFMKKEGLE